MLRSPVKLALSALAVVLSWSQSAPNGSSNGGNAAIAGALDAASVAAIRGQTLRISVVGTQTATQADTSGRFALSGLPAGTAGVRFQAPGIDSTLQIRGLVPRQTMRISVRIDGRNITVVAGENQATLVGTIDAIGTSTLTISGLSIAVNDKSAITAITPPDHFVISGVVTVVVNADTVIQGEGHHRGPSSRRGHDLRFIPRSTADHGGDDDDAENLTFADLKVGDEVEVEGIAQA